VTFIAKLVNAAQLCTVRNLILLLCNTSILYRSAVSTVLSVISQWHCWVTGRPTVL